MRSFDDLRPYQRQAAEFALGTPRGYLAAKAGAGKTAVALAVIAALHFDRFEIEATLIVAPKRVVGQWAKEARNWTFGAFLRFGEYLGTTQSRKNALEAVLAGRVDVLVVSFEFFPELVKALAGGWPFGLVVFDEASRLRSGGRKGSVGWKVMWSIATKTDSRMLLMSGSPRPGTAHELFAPVALLDQGKRLGTTLTGFRTEYLEPRTQNRHTGQVYSWQLRAGKEAQLYDRIADLYFAVAPDLGLQSVTIDRWVHMPDSVELMARRLRRTQVVEQEFDLEQLEITAASQGTVEGKLWQIAQGAVFGDDGKVVELHSEKLDELEQILAEVDAPAVVAYWHTHDKARLMKRFPQAVDITTEQGLAQAQAGQVDLALIHPAAAGHGVDGLQQHFDVLVWFTNPPSYELYEQTNARIVRSGQKATVRIYRIIAGNNPVDPKIITRLAEKAAEQDQFYEHLKGKAA